MNAKNSRASMTHFVVHRDAGEDTNAEEGDLFPRQRRHDIVHEFMTMRTMRTCFARVFTQAAPGVGRNPSSNAWSVSLIACWLCVPETALAQGGHIGEGPGWMPILLGMWLGLALIFGTFSVVPLKLLKRRHHSFGLKKAVTGAYLLPLFSPLVALAAAEHSDSQIIIFFATIGVIQLIYIGMVWLFSSMRKNALRTEKKGVTSQSEQLESEEVTRHSSLSATSLDPAASELLEPKHVHKHRIEEGNKNGRRRTTMWLLFGAIALLLPGIVMYLSSRDTSPFHDQTEDMIMAPKDHTQAQYEEAIAAYQKAVEIKPDNDAAWYNLGYTYGKQERYAEAIAAYQRAIEIKPDNDAAWNNLGYTYGKQEQYEEAIAAFQKAIEIKPDNDKAWYNLGCVYALQKDIRRAVEFLGQAIQLDPENRSLARTDSDFDGIRDTDLFQSLLASEPQGSQ